MFTLIDGTPTMIFKDGTGFTTNSTYYHYLYRENGNEYLLRAAFFERQGSPWYFYEIFYLDENGNKIAYKGKNFEVSGLDYTAAEASELQKVREEYKECLNSSNVLVIPVYDEYLECAATTGWWYKDYQ